MVIQSISCSLPCCGKSEQKQTTASLVARVTAVGLGAITLLTGILALNKTPILIALSATSSVVLMAVGSLLVIAGIFLRCVKRETHKGETKEDKTFIDPRVAQANSVNFNDPSLSDEFYCSLEDFLRSENPQDVRVRNELIEGLKLKGTEDLTARIKQNFLGSKVTLALPLFYKNGIRDDKLLLSVLKLIYLPKNEILNKSFQEIRTEFRAEEINILILRLIHIDTEASSTYEEGSLGALRNLDLKDLLSLEESLPLENRFPQILYSKKQVISLLNTETPKKEKIQNLFLIHKNIPFAQEHAKRLLSELSIEHVNQILPFFCPILHPSLVLFLIETRGQELNWSLIEENVLDAIFRYVPREERIKKLESLPIEVLNIFLPKMGSYLRDIPEKHLKNTKLDLTTLSEWQVEEMFPTSRDQAVSSSKRISDLPIDSLNQILPKMSVSQLELIPEKHFKNSKLDLKKVDSFKLKLAFFSNEPENEANMTKKTSLLSKNNQSYIQGLLKQN